MRLRDCAGLIILKYDGMLKNYLTIALRNLVKNKGLSFINIFGLATGMAFAILIGLWIKYETSFDDFHVNRERIALVYKHTFFNSERNTQESTPLPLYYELKTNYPEVKRSSRLNWNNDYSLAVGDKNFKKQGRYVDPEFLDMFTFPIVKGNAKTALNDLHAIVITESLARTLFGSSDPIGKIIRMNNEFNVKVSAVIKDVPKNSSLSFDFLRPFEYFMHTDDSYKNNKTNWGNNFLMNVVELKEGVSMESFTKKLPI